MHTQSFMAMLKEACHPRATAGAPERGEMCQEPDAAVSV
jgi:hypothetical protein